MKEVYLIGPYIYICKAQVFWSWYSKQKSNGSWAKHLQKLGYICTSWENLKRSSTVAHLQLACLTDNKVNDITSSTHDLSYRSFLVSFNLFWFQDMRPFFYSTVTQHKIPILPKFEVWSAATLVWVINPTNPTMVVRWKLYPTKTKTRYTVDMILPSCTN